MIRSSRPGGNLLVRCVCIVAALLLVNATVAANLPHEDFGSLLYRSTDVVVAELQFSGNTAVAARVTEPLIGTPAGERLPGLANALASYTSLANGTRVILFLASCSRVPEQCGGSPQAKYRLLQSGVYLIDRYDRVHQYYQQSNPGLYLPQGYDEERSTLAQDLKASEAQKYPTVQQVKAHIATTAASVARVHALLAMPITKQQVPLLLHLVDRTSTDTTDCDLRQADAIAEDVA